MVIKKLKSERYSLNRNKLMSSGSVSSYVLLSSAYTIQKCATITPIMHLGVLQATILYFSCNKNLAKYQFDIFQQKLKVLEKNKKQQFKLNTDEN